MGFPSNRGKWTCSYKTQMIFICTFCMMHFLLPQFSSWKLRILSKNQKDFLDDLKEKIVSPFFGTFKNMPPHYEVLRNSTMTMQYRIQPNATDELLNRANVPLEFRTGHPLLSTRTYPRTPRKMYCHDCFPYVYRNIVMPNSCDAPGDIMLLIVITTVPSAREKRDAIRQTWLSVTKNNTESVRYLFLLGYGWPEDQQTKLRNESREFRDILQDDYIDSYFNLSIKVLSGFKYAIKACKQAQFIMRTADDNYVNIYNIVLLLHQNREILENAILGDCARFFMIIRDKTSKWAVTKNEWPPSRYPAYCIGTAFIMTNSTMKSMYDASKNVPYFVIEDVFFGEVARQAGIDLMKVPNMLLPVPDFTKGNCNINDKWRAVHDVSANQQYLFWKYCPQRRDLPDFK